MAGVALTPRVRMMVVCDAIKENPIELDVFDLKGVRQQKIARSFPFMPKRLWLFVVFSCPRAGSFPAYVRVIHDRTDRAVFFGYINPRPEFGGDSGLKAHRIRLRCVFPEAGLYTIQVWFFQKDGNDILKGELPFSIVEESE